MLDIFCWKGEINLIFPIVFWIHPGYVGDILSMNHPSFGTSTACQAAVQPSENWRDDESTIHVFRLNCGTVGALKGDCHLWHI